MSGVRGVYRLLAGATMAGLVTLGTAGVAQASTDDEAEDHVQAAGPASGVCKPLLQFRSGDFHQATTIDNQFLPMVPGTRLTYHGKVTSGGATVDHEVVFTVSDLVKDVDGVRSRVIVDLDLDKGEIAEAELAFFAQDDAGNVWNVGEYPEEYDAGKFTGAPSVWIAGLDGASGGLHMLAGAEQHLDGPEYLQGKAPKIDFLDCARVAATNGTVDVPAGHFTGVLTTFERSPLESTTAIQTKEHAPGVGIVRIGSKDDPQAETLELVQAEKLGQPALDEVDKAAFTLDEHGRKVSDVYRQTAPLQREGQSSYRTHGGDADHDGDGDGDHDGNADQR
jgi:hypothetical protein